MTTSLETSMSTYDFIVGNGTNVPEASPHNYAQLLFEAGESLHRAGMLKEIVGVRHPDFVPEVNGMFDAALIETNGMHIQVPVRGIYTTTVVDVGRGTLYVGYTDYDIHWVWMTTTLSDNPADVRVNYVTLSMESMAELFGRDPAQYGSFFGRSAYAGLVDILEAHERIARKRAARVKGVLIEHRNRLYQATKTEDRRHRR